MHCGDVLGAASEVSGSVAPKATVNLCISDGGNLQDPIALTAIRAVEDNQASVLSISFGNCEPFLGDAGNQFWTALWEQAAAQGQTAVASGDSGPACGGFFPFVSGIASKMSARPLVVALVPCRNGAAPTLLQMKKKHLHQVGGYVDHLHGVDAPAGLPGDERNQ